MDLLVTLRDLYVVGEQQIIVKTASADRAHVQRVVGTLEELDFDNPYVVRVKVLPPR